MHNKNLIDTEQEMKICLLQTAPMSVDSYSPESRDMAKHGRNIEKMFIFG
jgi:hypothetical protein